MITLTTEQAQQIEEALSELMDLMDGVREGDYKPDSFTNQPAEEALATIRAARAQEQAEQEPCKECSAKQAQIDRLMLEYCPDEMTPEQMQEWEKNIKPFVDPVKQEPFNMDDHPPHRLCECRKCMEYFTPLPDCDAFAASGKPIAGQTNTQLMEGFRPVSEMIAEHKQDPKKAAAIEKAKMRKAEQEPVGRWNWNEAKFEWLTKFDYHKHHMTPLYAAHVRTKDLTDDEIRAIRFNWERNEFAIDFARAVIVADREKNK